MKQKLLLFLILIIAKASLGQKVFSPDGVINYQINALHDKRNDLLEIVKKGNPNIIQLEMLKVKDNNLPLGISKYEGDEIKPIEYVLKNFVFNVKANDVTRTIERKSFQKEGNVFHRKISISKIEGKEVYNVMYYFMKNNKSNTLYEIKLNGSFTKRQLIDSLLFDIAKTVNFR